MNNELFFAQNKPILEDMKIIDIAAGKWTSSIIINNGVTEDLSLFSDQYSNWSELIEDIWKDAYIETKDGSRTYISKAMVRIINPSYQILFPVIMSQSLATTPNVKPTTVEAHASFVTVNSNGGSYQVNLNITYQGGTIQFYKADSN